MPYVVSIPPASLRNVRRFFEYLTVPHWRVVVSLTLTKEKNSGGQDYSQVHIQQVGTLSPEEGSLIKVLYTDTIKPQMSDIESAILNVVENGEGED